MTDQDNHLERLAGYLALAKDSDPPEVSDELLARFMDGELAEGTAEHSAVVRALAASSSLRERWRVATELAAQLAPNVADQQPADGDNVVSLRPPGTLGGRAVGGAARFRQKWLGAVVALAASLAVVTVVVRQNQLAHDVGENPIDQQGTPLIRGPQPDVAGLVPFAGAAIEIALSVQRPPTRSVGFALSSAARDQWLKPAPSVGTSIDIPLRTGYARGVARIAGEFAQQDKSWSSLAASATALSTADCAPESDCEVAAGLGAWAVAATLHCSTSAAPDPKALTNLAALASALVGEGTAQVYREWPVLPITPDTVCSTAAKIAQATALSNVSKSDLASLSRLPDYRRSEVVETRSAPSNDSDNRLVTSEMRAVVAKEQESRSTTTARRAPAVDPESPKITLSRPDPSALGALRSPLALELHFESAPGAVILTDTFKIRYGRWDITERVLAKAKMRLAADGASISDAQMDAGEYEFTVEIADSRKRVGRANLVFKVLE